MFNCKIASREFLTFVYVACSRGTTSTSVTSRYERERRKEKEREREIHPKVDAYFKKSNVKSLNIFFLKRNPDNLIVLVQYLIYFAKIILFYFI